MTAVRVWVWLVLMAYFGTLLAQWLDAFEALPSGTQGVVGSLVVALIGTIGAVAWHGLTVVAARTRAALAARREAIAASDQRALLNRLEFEASPADLGELDHGANLTDKLSEIQELSKAAVPPIVSIIETLVSNYQKLPVNLDRKRAFIEELAGTLRPQVLELERVATEIVQPVQEWTDAYRAIFTSTSIKVGDKKALAELQTTYQGGVADTFRQMTTLYTLRGNDIARFSGKQQALNRVVARAVAAIRTIATETGRVHEFCDQELPALIGDAVSRDGS